jgi:DNA-binding transcriptional LysR family regulator
MPENLRLERVSDAGDLIFFWLFKKLYISSWVPISYHSSLYTNGRTTFLVSPNSWAGVGAVFPNVEVRHLHAVIALGEELNFTKAALRLHLTQSALSRQITEIEKQLRFRLFTRDNRRVVRVELTDAGRVFVAEARSSVLHMELAFHLARTAHDGADNVLTIGHSHEADQAWVSDLLAVRLPLYPKLAIRLISQFSIELVRSVLAGELNLALVTAPPEDSQITAAPFALTPLYAALPESHAAAQKEHVALQDLANDEWILFARRVHSVVHDAIMDAARREGITPKHAHNIITPQEAIHLVSEHVGVAILTKPAALGFRAEGVVVKPLSDPSLCFQTCVIMRKDDDSRLANEFARTFLRRYAYQRRPPKPIELPLSARVVSIKKANPDRRR